MMQPYAEPNVLPPIYDGWQEWRKTYAGYVADYKESKRRFSDDLLLEIRLKRLGFVGKNLDAELTYVKENV